MIDLKVTVRGDDAILHELRRIAAELTNVLSNPDPIQTIVAETIMVQMDQESDPDGNPWPALSDSYRAYKEHVAPGSEMGRLFGAMKEPANLRGVAVVAGDTLVISYGVDPEAIGHAISFTLGGIINGTNQPPRPFYSLNTESERRLSDFFSTVITV